MTAAQSSNRISKHDSTYAYPVLHHPWARFIAPSGRRQSTRPWKIEGNSTTEMPPIKIKWQWEDQFDHLCLNAGWTPTTAVRNKIQEVAVMTRRLFEVEPALLAFVQHFDFIWEDGWILLGRKYAEEGFAQVWCKVVKLPVQTKLRFAQDADKVPFTGSRDDYHG